MHTAGFKISHAFSNFLFAVGNSEYVSLINYYQQKWEAKFFESRPGLLSNLFWSATISYRTQALFAQPLCNLHQVIVTFWTPIEHHVVGSCEVSKPCDLRWLLCIYRYLDRIATASLVKYQNDLLIQFYDKTSYITCRKGSPFWYQYAVSPAYL